MKYNKKEIMTKAWEMFKNLDLSFSECLKLAWDNAKKVLKALANIGEECHTWYGWKMLGYMVKHESKNVAQVIVTDTKTRNKTRVLSYFSKSQVEILAE